LEDELLKKFILLIFPLFLALFISTSVFADETIIIKLREFWPGVSDGIKTTGALAAGNYFRADGQTNLGTVLLSWDHDGNGIEECGEDTKLLGIKVTLKSHDGRNRLVLRGPVENDVYAKWVYDYGFDNSEDEGRTLLGYERYINLEEDFPSCEDGSNNRSTIAEVFYYETDENPQPFTLVKQWWGTWGAGRKFSGAKAYGYLDHSPFISPAVVAKLVLIE
jgi:hypothetical protein